MAEFLHEVVSKRELRSRELSPGSEDWVTRYYQYQYQRVSENRRVFAEELLERIFGDLEEGTDNADL
jgi:hypothetical protein